MSSAKYFKIDVEFRFNSALVNFEMTHQLYNRFLCEYGRQKSFVRRSLPQILMRWYYSLKFFRFCA